MEQRRVGCLCILFALFFIQCYTRPTGPGFSILAATSQLQRSTLCESPNNSAVAVCILTRERSSSSILCQVQHDVVNIIGAYIRDDVADNIIFSFPNVEDFRDYFQGEFLLDLDDDDEDEAAFLSGSWSVGLVSSTCASIMEGPLTNDYNVFAVLNNGREGASGIALSQYAHRSKILATTITHSVDNPTSARLIQGPDSTEDEIFQFQFPASQVREEIRFITQREDELYQQQQFYRIKANDEPNIDGTLHVIDASPDVNYAFRLQSANFGEDNSTLSTGCGLITLQCNEQVEYFISHNMEDVVLAEICFGNQLDGQPLLELNGVRSPIIGAVKVSNDVKQQMIMGNLFVRLTDSQNRTISGYITPEFSLFAYVSGGQEYPAVNTFTKGCALFTFTEEDNVIQLSYEIHHNAATTATAVNFQTGTFQQMSDVVVQTSDVVASPLSGAFVVDPQQVKQILSEDWYINFVDSQFPSGLARGQILRATESQCISYGLNVLSLKYFLTALTDDYSTSFYFHMSSSPAALLAPPHLGATVFVVVVLFMISLFV